MTRFSLLGLDPTVAFGLLRTGFERARTAYPSGCSETSYSLADRTVRFRIVGRELAQCLLAPFAHLEVPQTAARTPDLSVDLWDGQESQVPSPLDEGSADLAESGVIRSSSDGRLLTHERRRFTVVLHRADQHLVGWIESAHELQGAERVRPLNLALMVWCSDQEVQLIHAGLVARDGHGVLLAGRGGVGKSTAALLCAYAGFDFLGDDCVALRRSDQGGFQGYSFYKSITLAPDHLARVHSLPRQTVEVMPGLEEKAIVFPTRALRIRRVALIRAVALPRVVRGAGSRIPRATKAEALLALAPSSLIKRAVPPQVCLNRLARLVERVPSFWLEMGPDLAEIPHRVDRLLEEALRG